MKNFKDFNIKPQAKSFVGEKIKVKNLLNLEIVVKDFKIEPSKKKEGTQLLTLQIEKSGENRIVFTGSNPLIDQINQLPAGSFPFTTTIVVVNDHYEFT